MESAILPKRILYICHECKRECWIPLNFRGEIPTIDGYFHCQVCINNLPDPEPRKPRRKWKILDPADHEYFLPNEWKMKKKPGQELPENTEDI